MAHESLSSDQTPHYELLLPDAELERYAFPAVVLSEAQEISWRRETERFDAIMQVLQTAGLYDQDSLYCGIDADELITKGTFGDRRETWAVTENQFKRAAIVGELYGDGIVGDHNPLSYALHNTAQPALVIYDATAFTHKDATMTTDEEWQLTDGRTMDQATRSVVFFR